MSDWPRLPIRPEHLSLIRELLTHAEYKEVLVELARREKDPPKGGTLTPG